MSENTLPLLLEPDFLNDILDEEGLLVIDLSRAETHAQFHIPGAVFLDYAKLVRAETPAMGLLPDEEQLADALSAVGLTAETHVVAYDDEGGGKACRLLWTLELLGHRRYSLLNGGLHAWANEGYPLSNEPSTPRPSDYRARFVEGLPAAADRAYILDRLDDPRVVLLDARSPQEYSGDLLYTVRGGHIPGAINMEWTVFMDQGRNLRLKDRESLRAMLEEKGFSPDSTVVTYCQTHHRSSFTWFVLHYLGYRARGYPGSWSDWGNRPDTPIEA